MCYIRNRTELSQDISQSCLKQLYQKCWHCFLRRLGLLCRCLKLWCTADTLRMLAGAEAITEKQQGTARPVINIIANAAFIRASIAPIGLISTSGGADTSVQEESPILCSRPTASQVTQSALICPIWPASGLQQDVCVRQDKAAASSPGNHELVYLVLSPLLKPLSHRSYLYTFRSRALSSAPRRTPGCLSANRPREHTAQA